MEFHNPSSFFKTYSISSASRKTSAKTPELQFSNEDTRVIEGQRMEFRPAEATMEAATMLKSLSWRRVNDTAQADSPARVVDDGRKLEYHHLKHRDTLQQTPRSRMAALPKVSIPIEHQYQRAPPKLGTQFALPARDLPNVSWPLHEVEVSQESSAQYDFQQHIRSSKNSSSHDSVSPVSPCSSRQGRSPSFVSSISPISPLEPSPYPPPRKPLPSVPLAPSRSHSTQQSIRPQAESERSSLFSSVHSSPSEKTFTHPMHPSIALPLGASTKQPHSPTKISQVDLEVVFWKELSISGKRKGLSKVKAIDVSNSGSVVAIKHANYNLQFWNIASGTLQSTIEVPTYIDAGKRARDSFELGHVLISDSEKLAAIITNFGRTLEIWNWAKRKKLQTLEDQVDRWAADRFESYSSEWNPLAIYKARPSVIDLYTAAPSKKPYAKVRIIDLSKAELPYVPQQLELAVLPGSHMLVAAVGPKNARAGHPPPDREILLAAWDIADYREVSHVPRHFVRPLHHTEIDLAVPSTIVGYQNTVISIWVPPSHRVYRQPHPRTGLPEWKLTTVAGSVRHVLVWDLSGNMTRVYQVPNTVTCISRDCRFGAYSLTTEDQSRVVIVDAKSGMELQSIKEVNSGSIITELTFSHDAKLLMVGDAEGNTNVFEVGLKA